MRILSKIAFLMLVVMLSACRELNSVTPLVNVVAKVGDKVLTSDEIADATPANLSEGDSLSFVKLYVDNWLIKRLKVAEAEELFSEEVDDIERLVNDYRESLLMRRVDQYHIEQNMSEDFSDEDIASYFNTHKATFVLDETLVKGLIVRCDGTTAKSNVLRANIERVNKSASAIQVLQDACTKNGYTLFDNHSGWVNYSDFLSNLPTTKSQNYDHFLDKVGVQDIVSNGTRYYFYITSVCRKGNVAPVEVVSDKIRRILITQRRSEIIKSHEEDILHRAFNEGDAEIVKQID